ncbi:MAG: hypothetical protein ABIH50_04910 [bacterium]
MDLSAVSLFRYITPGEPSTQPATRPASTPAHPTEEEQAAEQTKELRRMFKERDEFARAQLERLDKTVCVKSCLEENPSLQDRIKELNGLRAYNSFPDNLEYDREFFLTQVLGRAEFVNEYLLDRFAILSTKDTPGYKDKVMDKRAAVFGLVRIPFTSRWISVKGLPLIDPSVNSSKNAAYNEMMLRYSSYFFFKELADSDLTPYAGQSREILKLIKDIPTNPYDYSDEPQDQDFTIQKEEREEENPEIVPALPELFQAPDPEAEDITTAVIGDGVAIELDKSKKAKTAYQYPRLKNTKIKTKLGVNRCYVLTSEPPTSGQTSYDKGQFKILFRNSRSDDGFAPTINTIQKTKKLLNSVEFCVNTRDLNKIHAGVYEYYIQRPDESNPNANHVGRVVVTHPREIRYSKKQPWGKTLENKLVPFLQKNKGLHIILRNARQENLYELWSSGTKVYAFEIETNRSKEKRKAISDRNINLNKILIEVLGAEKNYATDKERSDELLIIIGKVDNTYAFIKKAPGEVPSAASTQATPAAQGTNVIKADAVDIDISGAPDADAAPASVIRSADIFEDKEYPGFSGGDDPNKAFVVGTTGELEIRVNRAGNNILSFDENDLAIFGTMSKDGRNNKETTPILSIARAEKRDDITVIIIKVDATMMKQALTRNNGFNIIKKGDKNENHGFAGHINISYGRDDQKMTKDNRKNPTNGVYIGLWPSTTNNIESYLLNNNNTPVYLRAEDGTYYKLWAGDRQLYRQKYDTAGNEASSDKTVLNDIISAVFGKPNSTIGQKIADGLADKNSIYFRPPTPAVLPTPEDTLLPEGDDAPPTDTPPTPPPPPAPAPDAAIGQPDARSPEDVADDI